MEYNYINFTFFFPHPKASVVLESENSQLYT